MRNATILAWVLALAGCATSGESANEFAADRSPCLVPGLPLADDPSPQMMRAARNLVDAYRICMTDAIAALGRSAMPGPAIRRQRDEAIAERDRILERWDRYEASRRAPRTR